jgi:TonB family protein
MKKIALICLLLFMINAAKAQIKADTSLGLEKVAMFPGGFDKFKEYISVNLKYPEKAKINHIEGTVNVQFTVDTDGSVINIKVEDSLSIETNAEAVRVIRASPKWTPAIAKGHPIRWGYFYPVVFKLNRHNQ